MLTGIRSRLTFANVVSVIALFIALGGSVYAANRISGNDIKPDSITGKQVKESKLKGVDAASVGGLRVRKINYIASIDNAVPYASVLSFDELEITAACRSFGDGLDVKVTTTTDLATLFGTSASGDPDDTDGFVRRPFSSSDPAVDLDNEFTTGLRTVGTLHYQGENGNVVVVQLMLVEDDEIDRCFISGVAIGT